jgi:hypothetical protein
VRPRPTHVIEDVIHWARELQRAKDGIDRMRAAGTLSKDQRTVAHLEVHGRPGNKTKLRSRLDGKRDLALRRYDAFHTVNGKA